MSGRIAVISPSGLEPWDWRNPWTKGIGGSEVSHIEMCDGLKEAGFDIHAFTSCVESSTSPKGVPYAPIGDFIPGDFRIVIDYRHPETLDYPAVAGQKVWFVAQDVGYDSAWTDERLARIDRYLCLCQTHAKHTQSSIAQLRGKTFISSNGVRSAFVENMEAWGGQENPVTGKKVQFGKRVKHRMLYASSPDRGLRLILENWFRIKEKVPEAELRVAYGFYNCLKIVELMNGNDWRAGFVAEMQRLMEQPGVTFTGRLNQLDLYKEWFEAGVWFHPSDWAETSCITSMDAMATGCWPVANNYWAVGENLERVGAGDLFSGVPQRSDLVRSYMIEKLCDRLTWEAPSPHCTRALMAEKAQRIFDWANIVKQWGRWLEEDLKKC